MIDMEHNILLWNKIIRINIYILFPRNCVLVKFLQYIYAKSIFKFLINYYLLLLTSNINLFYDFLFLCFYSDVIRI